MWGLPMVSYYPAQFDDHRYCESADISFLNLSRGHVINWSRDFDGGVPAPQVTTLPSFVAIGIAERQT